MKSPRVGNVLNLFSVFVHKFIYITSQKDLRVKDETLLSAKKKKVETLQLQDLGNRPLRFLKYLLSPNVFFFFFFIFVPSLSQTPEFMDHQNCHTKICTPFHIYIFFNSGKQSEFLVVFSVFLTLLVFHILRGQQLVN